MDGYAGRVIAIYRDEVIIVGDNEGDVPLTIHYQEAP
jgi:hypothetical protein